MDNSSGQAGAGAEHSIESAAAHEAFLMYRDMGPRRSLRKAAGRLGKCESLLKRWSTRHGWRNRVAESDHRQQEEEREQARRGVEAAYERRVAHAEQLERVAMAGLRSLMVRDAETGEIRFDRRLKPSEIAALIRVACRLLPTSVPESLAGEQEEPGAEELGRLSGEDLEVLLGLLESGGADDAASEGADDEAD